VLSRPPLLTRPLHPFESAFFFYQRRLNERLAMPFSRYFYFNKDTPADNAWKRKALARNGSPARDLGAYNPYSELGWNDEVLVGDRVSSDRAMREALVEDAVNRGLSAEEAGAEEEEVVERPLERWTEADTVKDVRRLDRKLARTLYLVVKNGEGKWQFPAGELVGRENLHQVRSLFFSTLLICSFVPDMI
jgi:large subunit ribosomal protein L46